MRHPGIHEPAASGSQPASNPRVDESAGRQGARRVDQVMTSDVQGIREADSLNEAACSLWNRDCGALPVLDDANRVVGMITDRDICMAALWEGKDLHHIPVAQAMSRQICACSPADSVFKAQSTMRQYQVRRLPVVDVGGRLVGIISVNDILRDAARSANTGVKQDLLEAATTLSVVGAPRAFVGVH